MSYLEQLDTADVLALFGGIIITGALIVAMFMLPDLRELLAGALITIAVLIYNHFFQRRTNSGDPPAQ